MWVVGKRSYWPAATFGLSPWTAFYLQGILILLLVIFTWRPLELRFYRSPYPRMAGIPDSTDSARGSCRTELRLPLGGSWSSTPNSSTSPIAVLRGQSESAESSADTAFQLTSRDDGPWANTSLISLTASYPDSSIPVHCSSVSSITIAILAVKIRQMQSWQRRIRRNAHRFCARKETVLPHHTYHLGRRG
jgi:hypothetical protein